jgi:hypothetical protein
MFFANGFEVAMADDAAEIHAAKHGGFKTSVDRDRFMFYHIAYPVWPRRARDGLYTYRFKIEDDPDSLSFRDISYNDPVDDMYYTPERCKRLKEAFKQQDRGEKLNLMLATVPTAFMNNVAYRTMQCELANINPDGNQGISDALIYSPLFTLESDRRTTRYKEQKRSMFDYFINGQKLIVLDTITCLKELGIEHFLDAQTLIDLYEYSMLHPNAVLCHSCRHFDWVYKHAEEEDAEYIMCMNHSCKFAGRRRDVPIDQVIALPFHGFKLYDYYEKVFDNK